MAQPRIVEPKQKRSFATKQRVKDATKMLFIEQGYDKVSSNHIAKAAGVPVGSFYNYFGNKKAILLELIEEFNDQFHSDTLYDELLTGIEFTGQDDVLLFIESHLRQSLLSSNLSDPFYKVMHALQFTEPEVLDISNQVRTAELTFLVQFLELVNQFHSIDNIPVMAKLIHASTENLGLYIHHLGTTIEKELLISETAKMFHGYIFNK